MHLQLVKMRLLILKSPLVTSPMFCMSACGQRYSNRRDLVVDPRFCHLAAMPLAPLLQYMEVSYCRDNDLSETKEKKIQDLRFFS